MTAYIVVDSGTSNTRVRLWQDGCIRAVALRPVGARDTAAAGHNRALRAGLRDAIAEVRRGGPADAVICSGMITSGLGLIEVPHLHAPVRLEALAEALVQARFPDVCELPFYFVPGIKTQPAGSLPSGRLDADTLSATDLMRGEETEVAGLLCDTPLVGRAVFVHLGSHHKAIEVVEGKAIHSSRTALTGELLDAVRHHSVLAGSLPNTLEVEPAADMWRLGLELVRKHGLGRALFLVRAGEQLWGHSPEQAAAMLIGMLVGLDLQMIEAYRDGVETTIIYGKGAFGPVLRDCLREGGYGEVRLLDAQRSDLAAAQGAVDLFERARDLDRVEAVAVAQMSDGPDRR